MNGPKLVGLENKLSKLDIGQIYLVQITMEPGLNPSLLLSFLLSLEKVINISVVYKMAAIYKNKIQDFQNLSKAKRGMDRF